MLKKGFDLFCAAPDWHMYAVLKGECCEVCTFPLQGICKAVCKYRRATVDEFLDNFFGKG